MPSQRYLLVALGVCIPVAGNFLGRARGSSVVRTFQATAPIKLQVFLAIDLSLTLHNAKLQTFVVLILAAMRSSQPLFNSLFLSAAYAQFFPTTVKLDLIFPHNETYAPTPLMPLVWVFRNLAAWSVLEPFINWEIYRIQNGTRQDSVDVGSFSFADQANPLPDPFFFPAWSVAVANEGNYSVFWHLSYNNCTVSAPGGDPNQGLFENNTGVYDHSGPFAVSAGGQVVDLAMETECPAGPGIVFNVTDTRRLNNSYSLSVPNPGACPVLAEPEPSPDATITATASLCASTFGTSLASSIECKITSQACSIGDIGPVTSQYNFSCPPTTDPFLHPSPTASSGAAAINWSRAAAASAFLLPAWFISTYW